MAIEIRVEHKRLSVALAMRRPWTVVFGQSGSGKTSLLRAIAGTWALDSGTVQIDQVDHSRMPAHVRRAALLAQHPKLFPHMTVLENITFHGDPKQALEWIRVLKLEGLERRKPHELSGGQQQRCALARALATSPRVLLLDESFSGTDVALRAELVARLKLWLRASSAQIVSVTHDVAEALECADEVVKLADGRVIAQGVPEVVLAEERASLLQTLAGPRP